MKKKEKKKVGLLGKENLNQLRGTLRIRIQISNNFIKNKKIKKD